MNKRAKQKESSELELNRKSFDKILKICFVSGIIIVSGFIIYYLLNPTPGYVTFGLLNSEKVIGEYPTQANVSEDIEFYALVENHLGMNFTFELRIYKGDNQTQISPTGSANADLNRTTAQVTLIDSERWISDKLTISFLKIGTNQTIIVELWQVINVTSIVFNNIAWFRLNITA